MADPVITLTTDFGTASPYVAAVKGVILSINPVVRLVDLSHDIPPQDVRHAAFFLASALPYFPSGTLHVVVVDPGVGTDRALLYLETAGQRVLAPDNGCLSEWIAASGQPPLVRHLQEPRFWRQPVSHTFHGRDILAPVAGHLSLGLDPAELGPLVSDWILLERPALTPVLNGIRGEIVFIDHFGNLISNIPAASVGQRPERLIVGSHTYQKITWVRSYAEAKPGTLVALISSSGHLELAVVQGNAALWLKARIGTPLTVCYPG
jgi:S-adenosylmethionine hydrolase